MVGAGLQIVHVLGFILLLSSIVLISLRLLNLAFAQQPISKVGRDATRLIWIGLVLTVVSGTLMFVSSPRMYYLQPGVRAEDAAADRRRAGSGAAVAPGFGERFTEARRWRARRSRLSLAAWFGVGLAGRIIGFI